MYEIGDKIVYPMHGAGTIVDIQTQTIMGDEQSFYIIKMPIASVKILVPVDNADNLGVRPVIKKSEGKEVIEVLKDDTTEMSDKWNQRYRENLDIIRTGDIFEIAQVVKNLKVLDETKGLSTTEKKMLDTSKKIIVSELVLIGALDVDAAKEIVDEAITLDEDDL